MKEIINEIKDRIYEAEGLLELLLQRPDRKADLCKLIESRLSEASTILKKLKSDSDSHNEKTLAPQSEICGIEPDQASETPLYKVEDNPEPEKCTNRLPPAFCVNDRYRFRRAIFGGSDAEFNATMEHLAGLDSYRDAEELFFQDMGLNPEDPDVVDFMSVIKDYFKA